MQWKHQATIPGSLGDKDYLFAAVITSISSRRLGSSALTPFRGSLHSDVHDHTSVMCSEIKDAHTHTL